MHGKKHRLVHSSATTSFADKGTIVAKTKLLEGWTRDGVKSLFGRAERVTELVCAY